MCVVPTVMGICAADAFVQSFKPKPAGHGTQPLCHECHSATRCAGHRPSYSELHPPAPRTLRRSIYRVHHVFDLRPPPIWSPLLNASDRAAALRSYSGQCLNCLGRDHSVTTCQSQFGNNTGILNPRLGELNGGDNVFQQWQKRTLSYRRGQHERRVQHNSNDHSKRSNSRGRHSSRNS